MLVSVTEGTLKGEKLKNKYTGEDYYSFKGIPFAKPPVGPLRFKNPAPPEKYDGVWDATDERPMCLQHDHQDAGLSRGAEDCLYLNVFIPQLPETGGLLKPVMFYVFGGRFMRGWKNSNRYGPDFLVTKDVVLVIPNHRLHIFGFLNLGIEECPGNVGIKDLVAALEWTKQNIGHFGGNPNNITIFGHSSGAVLVQHILYSPLTRGKGLFHKALLQSIPGKNSQSMETSIERGYRVAERLNFKSKNLQDLYNFLMEAPALELAQIANDVVTQQEKENQVVAPFMPSVEVAGPMNERLLPTDLTELINEDPGVPVMTGVCSLEASFYLQDLISGGRPPEEIVQRVVSAIVPFLFENLVKDEVTRKQVIDKFKQFYLHGKSTDEGIILGTIDLLSDLMIIRTHHDFVRALLRHSSQPIYCYLFSYRASLGILEYKYRFKRPSYMKGAGHSDDIGYLFYDIMHSLTGKEVSPNETDKKVINFLTTLWTNFAKYGSPGHDLPVEFRPATSTDTSYLDINEELNVKSGIIFEERMKFIDDVYGSLTSE